MKIKFLNVLLLVSIVSFAMLSSCKKNNDDNNSDSIRTGSFIDSRDGKIYKWVTIGHQDWMAENLAYTGNDIRHISNDSLWITNSDYDGWCYYENKKNYSNTYGVLYQWEAAKIACPKGWHLPTDEEWDQLVNYLKENGYSYNGVIGNDGIAKSLATDYGWCIADNLGAVGNPDFTDYRNKTGFSALPAGVRNPFGEFNSLESSTTWWKATDDTNISVCIRNIDCAGTKVYRSYQAKWCGFSVRCIRD